MLFKRQPLLQKENAVPIIHSSPGIPLPLKQARPVWWPTFYEKNMQYASYIHLMTGSSTHADAAQLGGTVRGGDAVSRARCHLLPAAEFSITPNDMSYVPAIMDNNIKQWANFKMRCSEAVAYLFINFAGYIHMSILHLSTSLH